MAERPWQCSECGTINEPVANSCRTCGRWPSLFDLEASTFDTPGVEDELDVEAHRTAFEPAQYDTRGENPVEVEPAPEPQSEQAEEDGTSWKRRLPSLLVPLAFVVYLLISLFFNDQS